jgi:cyclase
VINSIDADGTRAGYDLELLRQVSGVVGVPVIASGGAGSLEHMLQAVTAGQADAALAASIFHFGTYSVAQAKTYFAEHGVPVRRI